LIAVGLGAFFMPVYWRTCKEQTEDRQPFQHNSGIVPQESLDTP
jgi:hypothetical protein